ncbi:hypothetical protein KIN20_025221 [Parelaphostrongylus tenuis]|uniref:Uncharacterized protein n=1 Tax=Parelaphostrongylus tenuis TaxID=148309 RepID=A0AAD5MUV2_PARTN|nr:hypothetical protein KIN20_025221 [Parelaphostrongylus tenuis]
MYSYITAFRRMVYLQKHQKRCTGEPRRRRFKKSPCGSSSTICATPSHTTTHGVGDESMTRATGEYHSNEQSLPAKFPRVTEDESPEKLNRSMDRHLENCRDDGMLLNEEESEIIENDSIREEEIRETQTTPSKHSTHRKSPNTTSRQCGSNDKSRKSLFLNLTYNSTAATPSKKGQTRPFLKLPVKSAHKNRKDCTGDLMTNRYAQANSEENAKNADFIEDGEKNDAKTSSKTNLEEAPVVEKEQRKERMSRINTKFEPREYAVAPIKRSFGGRPASSAKPFFF